MMQASATDLGARRAARRLRIVVAGEFGAGKSSVINALLRRPVLPANTGALERPVISVVHGPELSITCTDAGGRSLRLRAADELRAVGPARRIDVIAPMPALTGVELVELPFYHDGTVDAPVLEVMARADLLIWVTIASQAWRLSEKAIVETLPREGREQRILAISRADKLRSFADWDKIESRLQRETSSHFSELVFLRASNALLAQAADSPDAWEQSGGAAVARLVRARFGDLVDAPAPVAAADTPADPAPAPSSEPAPAPPPPGNVIAFPSAAETVPEGFDAFGLAGSEPARDTPGEEVARILDMLAGLSAAGIGHPATGVERILADPVGMATRMGLASAAVLAAHARGAALLPGAEPIEEILSTIGRHVVLVRPLGRSGRFLFLVLQRDRTGPAIARVAARRAAMLLDEGG
jgi:hypothetical protein